MNQSNMTLRVFYILLATMTLFSCSKENEDAPPKIDIPVNPILNSHDVGTVSFSFTASAPWVLATTDTKATVTWFTVDKSSGNAGTHTVSITIVEANPSTTVSREGYIKITSGITTQTVTVSQPKAPVVSVTGVSLDKATASLLVGATETLTATVNPTNATNKEVTWSSSDTAVATVNNGVITAVAPGSATITVTTQDGSQKATCTVAVKSHADMDGSIDDWGNGGSGSGNIR